MIANRIAVKPRAPELGGHHPTITITRRFWPSRQGRVFVRHGRPSGEDPSVPALHRRRARVRRVCNRIRTDGKPCRRGRARVRYRKLVSARVLHRPLCPFCRRLRAYLAERDITDFELVGYDPERHHDELCGNNPKAQVPTWQTDDGLALFESAVIMEYLEETRPEGGLLPSEPAARAVTRMLYNLSDTLLVGPLKLIVHPPADDPARIGGVSAFREVLAKIEPRLDAEGPFALGSDFTMADLSAVPLILRAIEGGMPASALTPRMRRKTAATLERPSVRALYPDVSLG